MRVELERQSNYFHSQVSHDDSALHWLSLSDLTCPLNPFVSHISLVESCLQNAVPGNHLPALHHSMLIESPWANYYAFRHKDLTTNIPIKCIDPTYFNSPTTLVSCDLGIPLQGFGSGTISGATFVCVACRDRIQENAY